MHLAIKKKNFRTDSKVFESLIFITKAPFISCSNLNDAKTMIMYYKDYKTLSVVNLVKIKKWLLVRTLPKWVGVNFVDGNYPINSISLSVLYLTLNLKISTISRSLVLWCWTPNNK